MAGLQKPPTRDLEAYDLYVHARDLFRWSGIGDPHENGEKALPLLDQALARDPQFALAHYLTSRIHGELFWFGYDKSWARLAKAKAAAETALRLRPELGEGTSRARLLSLLFRARLRVGDSRADPRATRLA